MLPYTGVLPACDDGFALARIQRAFYDRESDYWQSGLAIESFGGVRETGLRVNGASYIPAAIAPRGRFSRRPRARRGLSAWRGSRLPRHGLRRHLVRRGSRPRPRLFPKLQGRRPLARLFGARSVTKKFSALLFGMLLCLAAPRARADDCILDRCADKAAPAPAPAPAPSAAPASPSRVGPMATGDFDFYVLACPGRRAFAN